MVTSLPRGDAGAAGQPPSAASDPLENVAPPQAGSASRAALPAIPVTPRGPGCLSFAWSKNLHGNSACRKALRLYRFV